MASELKPCPFCSKTMMLRSALWPSEGDADAIIHADPTDCPMLGFSDGSADGSIIEKWNCSLSNEDDFPSDGSCVRCGSVPRNANGLCNTCLDEDAERLENTRPTPVAPVSPDATGKCEGLVTVAWFQPSQRCCDNGWMEAMAWQEGEFSAPVVLRSQAVELLAAKDQLIQSLIDFDSDEVKRLEADNAALTARIKELEQALETEKTLSRGDWACQRDVDQMSIKIEALEADLAATHERIADLENKNFETEEIISERDDRLALVDRIADLIGLPHDQELDHVSFELWFSERETKLAAAEKALKTARPYVEDYDTRRHNTGVDETLTQIDAALGGKPS
ncbi:hypothetical protein [Brucella intermedia]|uniref:hypothetical protein n=1 Tax=Brucella intermedia TaxID=94625 RepID=UPI00124E9914|nr:hypothetical protein [Brucella intermedia]KAB2708295.1 hypothetical protein F9K80_14445 [Brucella intermedia]